MQRAEENSSSPLVSLVMLQNSLISKAKNTSKIPNSFLE